MQEILDLERQSFRFGPRRRNGIDRFDYEAPGMLTEEQSRALCELKHREADVCAYLVERANVALKECREICKKRTPLFGGEPFGGEGFVEQQAYSFCPRNQSR